MAVNLFSIRTNQYVFGVAVGMAATYFIANYYQSRLISELENSLSSISRFQSVELLLIEAESGQRGYLLTGKTSYLQPYILAAPKLEEAVNSLDKTTIGVQQQKRIDTIRALANQKLTELQQTVLLKQEGKSDDAISVVNSDLGKDLTVEIRATIQAAIEEESAQLAERKKRLGFASRLGIPLLVAVTILIVVAVHFWQRGRHA